MNALASVQRRILLVDDDPSMIETLRLILSLAGFEIIEASTGAEALSLAQQLQPDLALLDAVMPGMSGIDLAKHLHDETNVPFMFVSSSIEDKIVKQATAHGAVGFLVKPFDVAQIVPAVNAALARADEIKRLRRSENELSTALSAARETSMAVGLLMSKYKSDRDTSFEILRSYSRSHRCKIHEVAKQLLEAEELLNGFDKLFSKH